MIKQKIASLSLLLVVVVLFIPSVAQAYTFDQNRIIDDSVFNNFGSMSSAQIDNFLNGFPTSCISSNSGFMAVDPIGYNPTSGYQYGDYATAGKVIADAAAAYGLNPQVLITTLQKEQSLVIGGATYCNDGSQHKYAAAVGYGCPDSVTTYSYTGLSLYRRNGVVVTDTGTTCVNSASKAGFSQQVIRAAWLLKFGQQRSRGNVSWAVVKGTWDNSDDPQSCYGGPTTQGTFAVCPSAAATYHDGYYTIDATLIHVDSGATAALYWYTPHFHGNQNFYDLFTQWFGSTKAVTLPGCNEATNTTRSCVWYLSGSTGQPYLTSQSGVRQSLVDNDNFNYQGVAFFGNVVPLAGNVPVYRLDAANGSAFLTASKAEYDSLSLNGFKGAGIDFYADPGNANTGYPVFRLFSAAGQNHRWVATVAERNSLVNQGYSYEGVAFTSVSSVRQEVVPPAGQELVYRFGGMPGNSHFWTRDVYERDQMILAGYRYEGVAWRASQSSTSTAVYRLYAPDLKAHLFTADAYEKSVLTGSGKWQDEGLAFYGGSSSAGSAVYRLYSPITYEHFFTTDAYEQSVITGNGTFRAEGNAWYQP